MKDEIPLKSVFNAYVLILKAFINVLAGIYNSNNVDDIKSYQVVILKRIYKSLSTIEVMLSQCSDPISSYGLLRIILDSVCAYCFIYDNANGDEVAFRHYLYLLDGCSKFNELCSLELTNNTIISETDNMRHKKNAKLSINDMQKIQDGIERLLLNHHYMSKSPIIARKIIKAKDWKYKSIESDDDKNYYDWKGIYKKVGCNQQMSDFVSKYLSQFVHGLFLSNARNPNSIAHYSLIYDMLVTLTIILIKTLFKVFDNDNISKKWIEGMNFEEIVNNKGINSKDILDYYLAKVK